MSGVVPSIQCYGVQKQRGGNLLNLHIFEVLENPVFSKSENDHKLQMVSLRWCKENMCGSRIFVNDICWSCQAVSNSLYDYILSWIQYDSASPTLNPILNTPSKLRQYCSQVKHCVTRRNEPHQHLPFWMLRCKLKLLLILCKLWHSISKNDTIYYMQVILSMSVFIELQLEITDIFSDLSLKSYERRSLTNQESIEDTTSHQSSVVINPMNINAYGLTLN